MPVRKAKTIKYEDHLIITYVQVGKSKYQILNFTFLSIQLVIVENPKVAGGIQ